MNSPVFKAIVYVFVLCAGSRIRAVVAQTSFDEFHRHSAQIIRHAVFGESGSEVVKFPENRLVGV